MAAQVHHFRAALITRQSEARAEAAQRIGGVAFAGFLKGCGVAHGLAEGRREFHDDRAAFFQTYFNGHQEYVYLLKIVNPGKFRISPASVQPMYQPSVLATTDAATLEVK